VGTQRLDFGTINGQKLDIGREKGSESFVYRYGIGAEFPLGKRVFLDLDVSTGTIINFNTLKDLTNANEGRFDEAVYDASTSLIAQARLTAGFKLFEHLGLFGGISYDYLYRYTGTSPDSSHDTGYKWSDGRNVHKLGFFGGVQF
jgi:hypothetical protein